MSPSTDPPITAAGFAIASASAAAPARHSPPSHAFSSVSSPVPGPNTAPGVTFDPAAGTGPGATPREGASGSSACCTDSRSYLDGFPVPEAQGISLQLSNEPLLLPPMRTDPATPIVSDLPTTVSTTTQVRKFFANSGGMSKATYKNKRMAYLEAKAAEMTEPGISHEAVSTSVRKRIAVACGRCRKRKIRCSGGQPCVNCKNAGHEPCEFLRVASQEIQHDGFQYNFDPSRHHFQGRGQNLASLQPHSSRTLSSLYQTPDGAADSPYSESSSGLNNHEGLPFRGGAPYAYDSKPYYPVNGWDGGPYSSNGAIEYAMYQSSYPTSQPGNYSIGYRMSQNGPTSVPKPTTNTLFLEPEPMYGYEGSPASALMSRPPSTVEPGSCAYTQTASALPASMSDRFSSLHPQRSMSAIAQHPYRTESISSIYSRTSQSSNGGSSPATLSEPATRFNSFESSPMVPFHHAGTPSGMAVALPGQGPSSMAFDRKTTGMYPDGASAMPAMKPDGMGASAEERRSILHEESRTPPNGSVSAFDYKYMDTTGRYHAAYNVGLGVSNGGIYEDSYQQAQIYRGEKEGVDVHGENEDSHGRSCS